MKKKAYYYLWLTVASTILAVGCSDDDSGEGQGGTVNGPEKQFVISYVTDFLERDGFFVATDEIPSGEINPSSSEGILMGDISRTGFVFENAIYNNSNSLSDPGIQKFTVENGQLSEGGFITGAQIYTIASAEKGYYWNPELNPKAIQTFNPTTMQRTGEIDLSAQLDPMITDAAPNPTFNQFMSIAAGKLYTQVSFTDDNGLEALDRTDIVVMDISTDSFDGMASFPEFLALGYYGFYNQDYVGLGDDGFLYLTTQLGLNNVAKGRTLRIRAGETEFDPNFEIDYNTLVGGSSFVYGGGSYLNGKLYVSLKDTPLAPDFSNLNDEDMFLYEVDVNTQSVTKINNAPRTNWFAVDGPFVYEDEIVFPVNNSEFKGYYTYDPNSGDINELFEVSAGAPPTNIFILEN